MAVETQGAQRRPETVGQAGQLPLVVVVRDAATRAPLNDVSVTFSALPSGSVEFPGGLATVTVRSSATGEAATAYTPRAPGQLAVTADAGGHGRATFVLECYDAPSTVQHHQFGGADLAVMRTPDPVIVHPEPDRGRTILSLALALLGLCFLAGLTALAFFMIDREPIKVPEIHTVEKQIVVPPVDNQARAGVAEEKKRNDAQDARLVEEDEINWAIGGNAQRALGNDDALRRDFERFYRGGSSRGASGSGGDVCSGPHWARYTKCLPSR